jgi:hypothetical protein
MEKPPHFSWRNRRGLLLASRNQAGVMLPEIIQRQKLFSLLHQIDLDLAEGVRSLGCPTVRDHCTLPPMSANRVVVPLAYPKHSPFAIVFAAVAKVAADGLCPPRCFSLAGGFIGAG